LDVQFLSFDQVRNIFHEFGHALNVALSQTKYQYYSCARGTTDLIEIPSHFTELFLTDYSFVRRFATVMEMP
jgi:peptidyl-dipeptidase Dcp